MHDLSEILQTLHQLYNIRTNRSLRYAPIEALWFNWHRAGFCKADLEAVLDYIEWWNKRNDCQFSNRLNKLLDPEHFEILRDEADQWQRVCAAKAREWKASKAEIIVGQFLGTPPVAPDKPAQPSREVLVKALEEIRKTL